MLCDWADVIVVMQTSFLQELSEAYRWKATVLDVGPDRWGPKCHSELKQLIYKGYDQLRDKGVF